MAGTLQHLADRLGVSVSTVSRSLSGKPGVSAALREKIRRCAAREGMRPNLQAQALRTGLGQGLTLVVRQNESPVGALRNQLILHHAQSVFPSVRVQWLEEEEALNDAMSEALSFRPAAVLIPTGRQELSPGLVRRVREQRVALVGIDRPHAGFDAVCLDRIPGMRQAAELLLDCCRRPVFMSLDDLDHPDARLQAVIEVYRERGLPADAIRVHVMPRSGPHDYEKGCHEAHRVLKAGPPPDGLFCFNDQMAIGALKALQEANLDVPGRVRVIGFDNLPETAYARVPLTTVAVPAASLAREAVALCLRRLQAPATPVEVKNFPTRLVVRKSAPLPAGNPPEEEVIGDR